MNHNIFDTCLILLFFKNYLFHLNFYIQAYYFFKLVLLYQVLQSIMKEM